MQRTEKWGKEIDYLKTILGKTELVETKKWGMPVFTYNNQNLIGVAALKNYVALWFTQGALLEDKHKVLVSAEGGKTIAQRQWRFSGVEEMDEALILAYVKETIELEKARKRVVIPKKADIEIPKILADALADKTLASKFNALPPYKQREFAEHIASAKQEKTRLARLEKSISLILEGKGLNDKYK